MSDWDDLERMAMLMGRQAEQMRSEAAEDLRALQPTDESTLEDDLEMERDEEKLRRSVRELKEELSKLGKPNDESLSRSDKLVPQNAFAPRIPSPIRSNYFDSPLECGETSHRPQTPNSEATVPLLPASKSLLSKPVRGGILNALDLQTALHLEDQHEDDQQLDMSVVAELDRLDESQLKLVVSLAESFKEIFPEDPNNANTTSAFHAKTTPRTLETRIIENNEPNGAADEIRHFDRTNDDENENMFDATSESYKVKDQRPALKPFFAETSNFQVDKSVVMGDFREITLREALPDEDISAEYAGLFGLTVEAESVECFRLFECVLRPDLTCREIMSSLQEAFDSLRLLVYEVQGSHVVVEPPAGNRAEWCMVDVQICIIRKLCQRALLCRFLRRVSFLSDTTTISPITHLFMEHLRRVLIHSQVTFSCLYTQSRDRVRGLDKQFLTQLEGAIRDRMHASFKESTIPMNEHASVCEWRCARMITTLQPIYMQHQIPMPDIEPVNDLTEYPLDTMLLVHDDVSIDEEEVLGHEYTEAVAYVLALRDQAWRKMQSRCDAELTARIRRFNARILDRVSNAQSHQRSLIVQLLGHPNIPCSALTVEFRKTFRGTATSTAEWEEPFVLDEEAPVYSCTCLANSFPCILYVTGGFLCFASRISGPFKKWVQVVALLSVESVRKYNGGYVPNTVELRTFTSASADPDACNTMHFTPAATDCGRVIDVIDLCVHLRREDAVAARQRATTVARSNESVASLRSVFLEGTGRQGGSGSVQDESDEYVT